MSVNTVVISGRVGRDPELRSTQNGKSVASFSIAVDDGFGEKKKTDWWDIEAWDKTAEAISRLSGAGKRVVITGKLKKESWNDTRTGEKKSRTKILANQIEIVDFVEKSQADGYSAAEENDDIPF